MNRGPIAEIDLNAISNNLKVVKDLSNNCPVIAVVKADAYGHGAVKISKRLIREGVEYLAVAFTEEAKELRDNGIDIPILVLFDPDIKDIFEYDLIPVVSDKKTALSIARKAEKESREINMHIAIDTGMGSIGFGCDAVNEILEIANLRGININGLLSHLSEADLLDASFAEIQINRFNALKRDLLKNGLRVRLSHIAGSSAIISLPESHLDAVRPGLMLYGYSSIQGVRKDSGLSVSHSWPTFLLRHAMTVKAKILFIRRLPANTPISYGRTFITKRDSIIGVISVGYADGFSRLFSNNAEVLVKGKKVPVAGRVCMDIAMVDLTDIRLAEEGDEVTILGTDGDETIDASVLASKAGTIPYEILTSLGDRAKRVYIGDDDE
ncbi:alanine racemase [Thermodesulfovibrionales bacterium]|nr:alanine racemase [Thermodesulfovibrionales bacterium]